MLSISDMETLRDAYSAYSDVTLDDAMERIGNASAATVVDLAVAGLASPDRNTRVLMLRVLQHQHGKIAMRGVCAGLQDPGRRVCAVAIQSARISWHSRNCGAVGIDCEKYDPEAQAAAPRT